MTELFHNAWSGWQNYIESGKMIALLPAALLFLWCGRKKKEQKAFLVYTTVMAAGCVLPVTAALLMRYQTGFYGYIEIWSLVPVTAVIAFAGAAFLTEGWENGRQWRNHALPAAALLLTAVLLGALPWVRSESWEADDDQRRHAYAVLEQLEELYGNESVLCLWAPREIMEYAREADAAVTLPYGRNIWDLTLNGYTFDQYGECQRELAMWMERDSSEWNENIVKDILTELIQEAEVNCILLPADMGRDVVRAMEETYGCQAQPVEEYIMFRIG